MTLSPKMLAVLQKIEAADAKHFAGLRESSPDSSPRNELRQDPALNLCRDGLIENAHRFLPLA